MIRNTIFFLSLFFGLASYGQHGESALEKRIRDLEDRVALKNLVDTFSILADQKKTTEQTLLFTENAQVETFVGGQKVSALTGRNQIGEAFAGFLKNFDIVYHINGQQTISIDGDKAYGISYCAVTLIGNENGKQVRTSIGVIYTDEFVRRNGRWLIGKRVSNFTWRDRLNMQ